MDWYQFFKDFAGPAATAIASGAAAFVAYKLGKAQADIAKRNWETQNEKVVLELMERRLAIYNGIEKAIKKVVQTGQADGPLYWQYVEAINQVPYLFGPEVEQYLETMRVHLIDLDLGNSMMNDQNSPDRQAGTTKRYREFKAVTGFFKDAPPLFRPYIRAHQKVPDHDSAPPTKASNTKVVGQVSSTFSNAKRRWHGSPQLGSWKRHRTGGQA